MKFAIMFLSIFCWYDAKASDSGDSPSSTNSGNGDVVAQFQVNNTPANVTCYAGPPGSAVAFNQNQTNGNNNGRGNSSGFNYNNNGGNYNNGGGNYNNNGNNSGQNGFNGSSGNNNNSVNGGTQTVLMPVRVPKGMAQQFGDSTAGSNNGGGQVCSCPSVTAAPAPAQSVSVMPAQGGVSYVPGMPAMMGGMIPGAGMMPGGMFQGAGMVGMPGGMMMPGYGSGMSGYNPAGGMSGFNSAAGMGGMLSSLFGGLGGSGSMNPGSQGGNFAMGGGISPDFQQTIQRIFSSGSNGAGSFGGGMNNFGVQGANNQYVDGNGYICRKQ